MRARGPHPRLPRQRTADDDPVGSQGIYGQRHSGTGYGSEARSTVAVVASDSSCTVGFIVLFVPGRGKGHAIASILPALVKEK